MPQTIFPDKDKIGDRKSAQASKQILYESYE